MYAHNMQFLDAGYPPNIQFSLLNIALHRKLELSVANFTKSL